VLLCIGLNYRGSKFRHYATWCRRSLSLYKDSECANRVLQLRYELDVPGIESRQEPVIFQNVQTGSGANPTSCSVGTGSFFPGGKAAVS
jgi:hypothetical protein